MSYHDPTICTAPFGPGQLVLEANPEFIKLFSENLCVSMHPGAMIELSKTYVRYKDDKQTIDVPTVVRLVPLAKKLQFDLKEMLSQGGYILESFLRVIVKYRAVHADIVGFSNTIESIGAIPIKELQPYIEDHRVHFTVDDGRCGLWEVTWDMESGAYNKGPYPLREYSDFEDVE